MIIHAPLILHRNWGEEVIFAQTPTHAGKLLRRKAGTIGGYQLHVKEETHYVLEGALRLRWLDADGVELTRRVSAGEAWTVPPGTIHQEEALEDSIIIEVGDPTTGDRYAIVPDPGGLPSMTNKQACDKLALLAAALKARAEDCEILAQEIAVNGLESLIVSPVR